MELKKLGLVLKKRLENSLPGQDSHWKMLPIERRPAMKYIDGNPVPRPSSILILLYPMGNYFGTILIRRTQDLSVHSGQISFPGGKQDPTDLSPVHTALREAEEEINLQSGRVEILGKLSPLYVSPSNFEITPVVGYIDDPGKLTANPTEVDEIIEIPLNDLVSFRTNVDISVREFLLKQVPCFNIHSNIVWGATAMILQELLDVLADIQEPGPTINNY
ncbi:MAG: CoA pyrophosphatase [Bacteroidales bacterium]|nr:CoA pyrophosphatase [Bacteroidales bacterium]